MKLIGGLFQACALCAALILVQAAGGATYYVDSIAGRNTNNGLTASTPWQTLQRINQTTLQPGDLVLLRAGGIWRETLVPRGSGRADAPIRFGVYGTGSRPVITGADVKTGWIAETVSTSTPAPPSAPTSPTSTTLKPASLWNGTLSNNSYPDSGFAPNNLSTWGAAQTGGSLTSLSSSRSLILPGGSGAALAYASVNAATPFKAPAGDFTIGGWIQIDSTPRDWASLFSFSDHTSTGFRFDVSSPPQRIRGVVWAGAGSAAALSANNPFAIGVPYHVVLRRQASSGQIDLFVNGVKQASSAVLAAPAVNRPGAFLTIGGSQAMRTQDLFIFDATLTDAEIQKIYSAGLTAAGIARTTGATGGTTAPTTVTSMIYYVAATTAPVQVFGNGTRLAAVSSKSSLLPGTYFFDSAARRLYLRNLNDQAPGSSSIEFSQRDFAIDVRALRYVAFSGLEARAGRFHGVYFEGGASNLTLSTMKIADNFLSGVDSWSTIPNLNNVIEDSEVANNGGSGIHFSDYSVGWLIQRNSVHDNCLLQTAASLHNFTSGIKGDGLNSSSNLVKANIVYGNGRPSMAGDRGAGIWIDTVGANNRISGNRVYSNRFHGIFVEVSSNSLVDRNFVYNNGGHEFWSIGIAVSGRAGFEVANNNKIVNNTVWNNLTLQNIVGIAVYGDGGPGQITRTLVQNNISIGFPVLLRAFRGGENDNVMGYQNTYIYNCFGSQRTGFVEWGEGRRISSYNDWQSLYGGPVYSPNADPIFTNPSLQDFNQVANSACVDRGLVFPGITDGYLGTAPDIGATER